MVGMVSWAPTFPWLPGSHFRTNIRGDGGVCVCYLGDGAVWQGSFHEALNLAGLYELPVIYVIENNHYAMGTSVDRAAADADLYKQSVSYAMPGSVVDGMDVFSVTRAMHDHVKLARENQPSNSGNPHVSLPRPFYERPGQVSFERRA